MTDQKHTYPDRHPPGTHWATDEAWRILDTLRPGVLNGLERALIAGMITGALMRVSERNQLIASIAEQIKADAEEHRDSEGALDHDKDGW